MVLVLLKLVSDLFPLTGFGNCSSLSSAFSSCRGAFTSSPRSSVTSVRLTGTWLPCVVLNFFILHLPSSARRWSLALSFVLIMFFGSQTLHYFYILHLYSVSFSSSVCFSSVLMIICLPFGLSFNFDFHRGWAGCTCTCRTCSRHLPQEFNFLL